jgi:hypothetical protein
MSVPDQGEILKALAQNGSRSTSWLATLFDVRGDAEFWGLRAALDALVEQKLIKLDTMGLWSVVAKPAPTPAAAAKP